jgi:hypothetical protein
VLRNRRDSQTQTTSKSAHEIDCNEELVLDLNPGFSKRHVSRDELLKLLSDCCPGLQDALVIAVLMERKRLLALNKDFAERELRDVTLGWIALTCLEVRNTCLFMSRVPRRLRIVGHRETDRWEWVRVFSSIGG